MERCDVSSNPRDPWEAYVEEQADTQLRCLRWPPAYYFPTLRDRVRAASRVCGKQRISQPGAPLVHLPEYVYGTIPGALGPVNVPILIWTYAGIAGGRVERRRAQRCGGRKLLTKCKVTAVADAARAEAAMLRALRQPKIVSTPHDLECSIFYSWRCNCNAKES